MNQANPVFKPLYYTRARYRVVYGGAGSSKSVSTAQMFADMAKTDARVRVLVLRKVQRTCRHSTFKLLKDVCKALGWLRSCRVNEVEMTLRFDGGGEILHAGLDDVEKLKSIAGITHIWVEEATELDFPHSEEEEADLAQIDLRLRGVAPELRPSITLTFNPTFRALALFEYLGVNKTDLPVRTHRTFDEGRVYVQHTTYLDNPWVGEDYVAVFRKLGGVMQAAYERGELVAVDAPDQLIKYEWVKAAMEREASEAEHDGRARMAVDVARFGDDETVIGLFEGWALTSTESAKGQDTTATGRRIVSLAREHDIASELIGVDAVGLGAGAVDTARDDGVDVTEIIGGAKAVDVESWTDMPRTLEEDKPAFVNLRSQMWWHLRYAMEAGLVAICITDEGDRRKLQEDLLAPRFRFASRDVIEVEPKDGKSKNWGIKKRLGRSPDYGDTLAMGVFVEHADPHRIDWSTANIFA